MSAIDEQAGDVGDLPANGAAAADLAAMSSAAADAGPGLAGDLALCLSGGGYRAAGFHLGVLDLLDRAGLLPRVRTLSTISGGTILGAAWALSRARREGFDAFHARAWKTLRSLNVVREAVARLASASGGADDGAGSASLIRAAARVHADSPLFGDAKLGELIDARDADQGPDELIFSATEFHSGRAYRFQTSRRSPRVKVGNLPPLEIPAAVAREVRLADVVAASSCFPGAFEPLVFPRDFAWSDRAAVVAALGRDFPAVPLMDGGIFDNQGVDGAVTVYNRAGRFDKLGLLLVSDTSQRRLPLFEEPPVVGRPRVRVRTLAWLAHAGFGLALLSLGALLRSLFDATWSWREAPVLLLTGVVPALLAAAAAVALWWVPRWIRQQIDAARLETGAELLPLLARLRLGDLVDLARRRVGSLLAMAGEVSMKRVRGLIQRSLLGDDSRFQQRAQVVLLYDLDERREKPRHDDLRPSLELQLLARNAEAVPTTLWLDDEQQLRDLVACGQATACLKLREHLRQRRAAALADPNSPEAKVEAALRPLWEELQENPYALLRRPRAAE